MTVSGSFEPGLVAAQTLVATETQPKQRTAPDYKPRDCRFCDEAIPHKRLVATKGKATACVPCQEANGDVPMAKMFTESNHDGDTLTTVYTENSYLEHQERRRNNAVGHLADTTFFIAAGDDQHLNKPTLRDNVQTEHIDYGTEDRVIDKVDASRQ